MYKIGKINYITDPPPTQVISHTRTSLQIHTYAHTIIIHKPRNAFEHNHQLNDMCTKKKEEKNQSNQRNTKKIIFRDDFPPDINHVFFYLTFTNKNTNIYTISYTNTHANTYKPVPTHKKKHIQARDRTYTNTFKPQHRPPHRQTVRPYEKDLKLYKPNLFLPKNVSGTPQTPELPLFTPSRVCYSPEFSENGNVTVVSFKVNFFFRFLFLLLGFRT